MGLIEELTGVKGQPTGVTGCVFDFFSLYYHYFSL